MAAAVEAAKESLLGTDDESQLNSQGRSQFMQHATKDEDTGDLYLDETGFVDAVAPVGDQRHLKRHSCATRMLTDLHRKVKTM